MPATRSAVPSAATTISGSAGSLPTWCVAASSALGALLMRRDEPFDPLPGEADLKTRLDGLDRQLNKKYNEVIAQSEKDRMSLVREGQRKWIKHRDEGAKLYVSLFPPAERERRRLQFLGDVTAARIDTPTEEWENS